MSSGKITGRIEGRFVPIVGQNMMAALAVHERDIESLSTRTQIPKGALLGLEKGTNPVTEEELDTICEELQLTESEILWDYGSPANAEKKIREILEANGVKKSNGSAGEPQVATSDKVDKVAAEPDLPPPSAEIEEDESVKADSSDDQAEETEPEVLDLTWDEEGLVATASDGTIFDLQEKELRGLVMGRIRTLLKKQEMTIVTMVKDSGLKKGNGWLGSVEKAASRIYRVDLEPIAKLLKVDPYLILSGKGIAVTAGTTFGRKTPKEIIVFPSVTPEEMQEYFRKQVFNDKTEPADGVTAGQLYSLAGKSIDEVDWVDAFFTLTQAGVTLYETLENIRKFFNKHPAVQLVMLRKISEAIES